MNSKLSTVVLAIMLIAALAYSVYTSSKLFQAEEEVEACHEKYGEALVDTQEAFKRLEEKEKEVQRLLVVAEEERKRAEEALAELKKGSRK